VARAVAPRPGRRRPVPSADLADVVAQLRRAMRRAARAGDPAATLSVAQLEMLSCLAENAGARPGQLARLLRLAPSSVATLTHALRRADLVTRTGGEADRRTAACGSPRPVRRPSSAGRCSTRTSCGPLSRRFPRAAAARSRPPLAALSELAGAVDALADEQQAGPHPPGQGSLAPIGRSVTSAAAVAGPGAASPPPAMSA